MAITDWPDNERPRERLLQQGASSLSDAELLAIFLRTGTSGKSAVDLARELLVDFGGLRPLMKADQQGLCRHKGIGLAKFALLQAALELGRRHLYSSLKRGHSLENPQATRDFLLAHMRDHHREVFACLYLDNRHRIIDYEELFYGTIDGANVHPREVVQRCLAHNAAALIVAHNHPSGVAEPSHSDERITERLRDALALVDIRLLDHMVVGDGIIISLAERGVI